MEKIKEELKSMQSNPNMYLANYFQDLKQDVDLTFFGKDDEKDKYLEIINKIEEIEQDFYKRSQPFNTYDLEIQSLVEIEQQSIDVDEEEHEDEEKFYGPYHINAGPCHINAVFRDLINIGQKIEQEYSKSTNTEIELLVEKSIDEHLKYRIEQKLFQNKTILFMKDFGEEKKTFLLIINNVYLRQSTFKNLSKLEYFNRESLIADCIHQQLCNNIQNNIEEFNDLTFLKIIEFCPFFGSYKPEIPWMNRMIKIKELDPATFNGFNSLKIINFDHNQIAKIEPETFRGLSNLEEIDLNYNKIKELDPATFNGLISLKVINFNFNQITKIHPSTFKSSNNLECIRFGANKIEELDPSIFKGSISLKLINFNLNQITKIHPSTFNGLVHLEKILFCTNKIDGLDPATFNGLNSLKEINFKDNQIIKIHPSLFHGLTNLKVTEFDDKIKRINDKKTKFFRIFFSTLWIIFFSLFLPADFLQQALMLSPKDFTFYFYFILMSAILQFFLNIINRIEFFF